MNKTLCIFFFAIILIFAFISLSDGEDLILDIRCVSNANFCIAQIPIFPCIPVDCMRRCMKLGKGGFCRSNQCFCTK